MISVNIRRFRKMYKLTQENIAERIGISRQAIAKWENGESIPDINSCLALSKLFGISLDELVKTEDKADTDIAPVKGRHIFGMVKVGDRGQIVIPKAARDVFKIRPGDSLLVLGDEAQGIAIVKGDQFLDFAQAIITTKERDGE